MKLVTFDEFLSGLLQNGHVIDLSPLLSGLAPLDWDEIMPAVIGNFEGLRKDFDSLVESGTGQPLEKVKLRAPVPRPSKIACPVMNFVQDLTEGPIQLDFFFKSPEAVIGTGDIVTLPRLDATTFSYEAELAVVIGKQASNVSADQAMEYVFGYTGFIDISGRDVGRPHVNTFLGSSCDTFAPMGPCLVTTDEIQHPENLQVKLSVNRQVQQDYSTSILRYGIPDLIEYTSAIFTLHPGDVITCGTDPRSAGSLQNGDHVVTEIQGIGEFEVTVWDPLKRNWR